MMTLEGMYLANVIARALKRILQGLLDRFP